MSANGTVLTLEQVAAATGGRVLAGPPTQAVDGVSIDSRTLPAGALFVAVAGPRFDGHDFLVGAAEKGAAAALVHRDAPAPEGLPRVLVADTTRALADLGRFVRARAGVPFVCITGSAGKTTTKEMTAALLGTRGPVLKTEGNLNNQYGLPLTLLRLREEHQAAVLELGMSAKGELRALSAVAQPDVAVITVVAPVHLEFFRSVDEIAEAKAEILEGLRPGGAAVLNGDDPRLRRVGEAHRGDVVWFGRDRSYDVSAENWRGTLHGMRFDLRLGGRTVDVALPLPGAHFVTNFLAAAAVAHRLGLDAETIARAAADLAPAKHRGQVLRLAEGVTVLDDCYNSNPVAVETAVAALALAREKRKVAFLGDMLELGSTAQELHRRTGEAIAPALDVVVGAGRLGRFFVEGARAAGREAGALFAFEDAAAAARAVADVVRPGDAVLVKGSRGAHMETVVEALVARFPEVEV